MRFRHFGSSYCSSCRKTPRPDVERPAANGTARVALNVGLARKSERGGEWTLLAGLR
jgi:hypothetical protein